MHFPEIESLFPILSNEQLCIDFLFSERIFEPIRHCKKCSSQMIRKFNRPIFRCQSRNCRSEESYRYKSFFSKSNLPCHKILQLGYFWLSRVSISSTLLMSGVSSKTLSKFYGFFRQLVSDSVDEEDVVIGGEGIIVEIDESKLGKRKYHRGHRVEGVWVFGGVELTPERKVFLVPVEYRNEETLLSIIQRHIKPGSIICSDMWRGYINLENNLICNHLTVNHSQSFVNPETGACTNTIEGTWNGLKIRIPPRNRVHNGIEDHLWEFIWRRNNSNDLWLGFLNALRDIIYE